MPRIFKGLCIPAFAIALLAVASASSADAANGISPHSGGLGFGAGHSHHGHPDMRRTIRRVYPLHPGYGIFRHRFRHPYYYHGPRLVPHHGHLDYVPGHWHFRPGHWR